MAVTGIITPVLQKAKKTAKFPRDWRLCKLRFCSSTIFVQIEQKWLATATEIVVLTKMVAISTDFVHFGQKWLVMSMWSAASTTFVRFGINLDNDKMLHKNTENVLNSQY